MEDLAWQLQDPSFPLQVLDIQQKELPGWRDPSPETGLEFGEAHLANWRVIWNWGQGGRRVALGAVVERLRVPLHCKLETCWTLRLICSEMWLESSPETKTTPLKFSNEFLFVKIYVFSTKMFFFVSWVSVSRIGTFILLTYFGSFLNVLIVLIFLWVVMQQSYSCFGF